MFKKRSMIVMTAMVIGAAILLSGCGSKGNNAEGQQMEEQTDGDQNAASDQDADVPGSGLTFTTQDIYGNTVTQDIFKDYDLTLVNLFATWCSPCIAEMPELAQLQKNMAEKNVNVVAVCLDSLNNAGELDLEALALAQQIDELSGAEFMFLVPDETYFNGRLIGIQAVPESFFVDSDGNIVGETYVGARDLATWTDVVEQELVNLSKIE